MYQTVPLVPTVIYNIIYIDIKLFDQEQCDI